MLYRIINPIGSRGYFTNDQVRHFKSPVFCPQSLSDLKKKQRLFYYEALTDFLKKGRRGLLSGTK